MHLWADAPRVDSRVIVSMGQPLLVEKRGANLQSVRGCSVAGISESGILLRPSDAAPCGCRRNRDPTSSALWKAVIDVVPIGWRRNRSVMLSVSAVQEVLNDVPAFCRCHEGEKTWGRFPDTIRLCF